MTHLTPLRTCLLAILLGLGLGAPSLAWAQDAGTDEDGGVSTPDASVGGGGADRDNPEGDDNTGRVVTNCRSSNDCSPRFSCDDGKCRYTGVRDATRVGCLLGPEGALVLAGLGLVSVWRRRR
ncbi:MAG: MXAN_6627.5 family MYXO-CTERM protein [Hyalangium sp.]|uniref:MXAN_6627.5 family MYXO-CTERM protein n=1 Tax=Hyalangium sp. TaxID=2028555 RepID=UPI003899DD5D